MSAVPAVISSRVVIMRMSVDLPAPFGPSNPKISPSATSKETPSTAVKFPKRFTMFLTEIAATSAISPFHLGRWNQHLGGHSGHEHLLAVVHRDFEHDCLDVPLAPVYIALGRELRFRSFVDHLAGNHVAGRQADIELIIERNMHGLGFGNGGAHPGVTQVGNDHDRLADID